MSATSCSMMTSMWRLLDQLTYIPTTTHNFLPPLTISNQKTVKGRDGGWVCGICWHRLMRENQRGGEIQRDVHKGGERPEKKVVWSNRGYTVAVAVVFHWTLEKNSVLPLRGACVVTWSLGHVLQKFMGARWFKVFGRLGIFFLSGFPNVLHKH